MFHFRQIEYGSCYCMLDKGLFAIQYFLHFPKLHDDVSDLLKAKTSWHIQDDKCLLFSMKRMIILHQNHWELNAEKVLIKHGQVRLKMFENNFGD